MRWVTMGVVVLATCSLGTRAVLAANSNNEVPFKLYRGYAIVVRGSLGNMKNLNFLLDTGAVPRVLDRRIAQKLHLAGAREKLSVFTEQMEVERVTAPNVQLGPHHADGLSVVVRDLSFASDAMGTRLDAMIGFDFLSNGPFTIDYDAKKILFGPIDSAMAAIPYEAHPGYATVEMKVQQNSLLLLVDSGASDLVLFQTAARDCQDAIKNVDTRLWSNMGGEIRVQEVQLKDAYLGSMPWGTRAAFVLPDGGNSSVSGLRGLLSVSSLKARRVGFDPEHRILAWDYESKPLPLTKAEP